MKTFIFVVSLVGVSTSAYSQLENRLRPGQMYEVGQIVYAPRFGFKSKIPQGWEGTLPREAEVFLLMPISPVPAEIFVLGNEKDSPEALKMRWT